MGIPQGSALGHDANMFADDTQIETSGYDINVIVDQENVSTSVNKLTLNRTKTEYAIKANNGKVKHIDVEFCLYIKDTEIIRAKNTKSPGIMIDETPSWNAQGN